MRTYGAESWLVELKQIPEAICHLPLA
jgi:hypothetical protein